MSLDNKKYQVWITEYAIDGNDPCSKHDPGVRLVGQFDTVEQAVECSDQNANKSPVITKMVTVRRTITDVTDAAVFTTSSSSKALPNPYMNL